MNTAAKGRHNEHKVRDFFIKDGYKVIRSAGSFGIADLVVMGKGKVYLVNIKSNKWTGGKETDALRIYASELRESGVPIHGLLARIDDYDTTVHIKNV